MMIEQMDVPARVLAAVDTVRNRDEMVREYAELIRYAQRTGIWREGWANVGYAIIKRWSLSGLEYIKRKAWIIAKLPEKRNAS